MSLPIAVGIAFLVGVVVGWKSLELMLRGPLEELERELVRLKAGLG